MNGKGKLLLQTCCAVCLEAVVPALDEDGWLVTIFFYNPNIHPYREFKKRLRAVEVACDSRKVTLLADREYGLATYLEEVSATGPERCAACYRLRLDRAAAEAKRGGFDVFSTTLLTSRHQKHAAVKSAGERAGASAGVEFLYRDWRDRLEGGIESARRRSLYRQQYCGCIWSEYERFGPKSAAAEE